MNKKKRLINIYTKLYEHFGPRDWWPARTKFEVMVGAILTQNAAWTNVEKAIINLRSHNALNPESIQKISLKKLKTLIEPSGFYNQKARRLKNMADFVLKSCSGKIGKLSSYNLGKLRKSLLNLNGIGPETADSILLYALGKCVFVVDAYTRRIFSRHGFLTGDEDYEEIRNFFKKSLPRNASLFNEYHALIVETGKNYCKKKNPLCNICPLKLVKPIRNMV